MKFILIHEYFYNCNEIKEIHPDTHPYSCALDIYFYDGNTVSTHDLPGIHQAVIDFFNSPVVLLDVDMLFREYCYSKKTPGDL